MALSQETIAGAVARALAAARAPAQPGDADRGPNRGAAKYARLSQDFRAGAWQHIREDGGLPQASNKAWGLVAATVKAISARHGGVIRTHRSIWA